MVKPLTVSLFYLNPDYIGAWKGTEKSDRGEKPVIKPMAYGLKAPTNAVKRKKTFPHELDLRPVSKGGNLFEANVSNGPNVRFLIPTNDIPGVNVADTVWGAMKEELVETETNWKEKYDNLRTEYRELEKEADRLREGKDEVTDKGTNKTENVLTCDYCNSSFPQKEWRRNDGYCPSCGELHQAYAGDRV